MTTTQYSGGPAGEFAELTDVGDRVIVASATDRGPNVLGIVIARDSRRDGGVLLAVLHENGRIRWHQRDALRRLGSHRMLAEDLAADLEMMGLPATWWAA